MVKRRSDLVDAKSRKRARQDSPDPDIQELNMEEFYGIEPDEAECERMEESYRAQVEKTRQARSSRKASPPQIGILSVEMHQFMCHRFLSFTFGDRLNFIIGNNGSGKSAVLTAITVCLGAKATATGRGGGLKSFIREGQPAAEVTVVLKNEGDLAYRPDVFGKKIIVTRKFTAKGASSYRICAANGTLISTKRVELQDICDGLGLQVDNPLSVLTQDASRQFIGTTSGGNKYKLFLRGTQLQQLSEEYAAAAALIQEMATILDHKSAQVLPELKEKARLAQEAYLEGRDALATRNKADVLLVELAWLRVREDEIRLTEQVKVEEPAQRRIKKIQETLEFHTSELSDVNTRMTAAENAHDTFDGDTKALNDERKALHMRLDPLKVALREILSNESAINTDLAEARRDITAYEKRLAEQTALLAVDTQAEQELLQIRTKDAKERIATTETSIAAAKQESEELDSKVTDGEGEMKKAQDDLAAAKHNAQNIEAEVLAVKLEQRDPLSILGSHLARVHQDIKGQQWHGEPPVGPVGAFVMLKDCRRWGEMFRALIGKTARSFIITDSKDLGKMRNILNRSGNKESGIIVLANEMFDYSTGVPTHGHPTAMQCLNITNPLVLRTLINSAQIERLLVADNWDGADKLLKSLPEGGVAVTAQGQKVTQWGQDGGKTERLNLIPGTDILSQLFRSGDPTARLNDLQGRLQIANNDCKTVANTISVLMKTSKQARAAAKTSRARIGPLQSQLRHVKADLDALDAESRKEAPGDLTALTDLIRETEKTRESLIRQFTHIQTLKVPAKKAVDEVIDELSALKKRSTAAQEEQADAREKLAEDAAKRTKLQHDVAYYTKKAEDEKYTLAKLRLQWEEMRQKLEEDTKKVMEQIGPRVDSRRKISVVERERDSLKRTIEARDRRQPKTDAQLEEEVEGAQNEYRNVRTDISSLIHLNKVLQECVKRRWNAWIYFRAFCAMSTKHNFQMNLSNRGFDGSIHMDHENGNMTLKIQTDEQEKSRDKNTLLLSGGEKSYSTICLLLALWETCSCPLRCLDEFDVFMDNVVRQVSMRMMMDTAQTSGKQYILITPQNMANVKIDPHFVKVLKMDDPERGQTTLNF